MSVRPRLLSLALTAEDIGRGFVAQATDVSNGAAGARESRWLRSGDVADLFLWFSKERLTRVQLSVYGQVMEWSAGKGWITGFLVEDERLTQDGLELVRPDAEPQAAALALARAVFAAAEPLEGSIRAELLALFDTPETWRTRLRRWLAR